MSEFIYGRNAVYETIRAQRRTIQRIYLADGIKESDSLRGILDLAKQRKLAISKVQRTDLDQRTKGANHQGVAVECSSYRYVDIDTILQTAQNAHEEPLILLLDHLQDPQNIGTLLRTAEVVGVHGIIMPDRRAAEITPAVVNASAGAVEHLNVVQVTNIVQAIKELKSQNIWIAGVEDDERAQDFDRANLRGALGLVIGAEGPGLARLTREHCDFLVRLPMRGNVASLNAATAGSIILYHAWRTRL